MNLLSAEEAAKQFNVSGYDPQARIIGQVLPHRASTLFSCDPAMSCYRLPATTAPITSFDLPAEGNIGVGWRITEDDGAGGTFRWAIRRVTSIKINLSDNSDLALDFKIRHWVEASVIDSLRLSVNDQDIPLTFTPTEDGGRLYHATIPRSVLVGQHSQTYFAFAMDRLSVVSDNESLGFALNWLRIRPN